MRAVQITAPGRSEIIEIPKPVAGAGEALIRPTQLSLCGSDTHVFYFSAPEAYPLPPGRSGHEVIGVVEAIEGESEVNVGDTVLALVDTNQGMAEYAIAPAKNLLALKPGLSTEELLQAQQLGTVFYASQHLPNIVNKDVALIGQGSAGLWWAYVLRRLGARKVIAVDPQAHRLALSPHYGATHTVHNVSADSASANNGGVDALEAVAEITGGQLADVVVEAAGEIDSLNLALDLVKRYGFIFNFGIPRVEGPMPFRMLDYFRKCVTTQSMVGALGDPDHSCTRMALELIASGEADAAPMLTHHFPFEQVQDAYELQYTRDEGAVKIVVDMPQI